MCISDVIPLCNIDAKNYVKMVEYWKKYSEEGVSKEVLMDFDNNFVKVDYLVLDCLLLVTDFLNDMRCWMYCAKKL